MAALGLRELHEAGHAMIGVQLPAEIRAEGARLTHHFLYDGQILLDDPLVVSAIASVNGFLSRLQGATLNEAASGKLRR